VAIARAPTREPKYVAVQLFGRPRALQFSFKITNTTRSAVHYAFAGKGHIVKPRYTITHTSCEPGIISFQTGRKESLKSRYEAGDGQVYTLTPARSGGVRVKIEQHTTAN